jgi:hypothetical protein
MSQCNGQLHWRPRPSPPPEAPVSAPCRCPDVVAITLCLVGGHVATLHSCASCGNSWDIDNAPAPREAVFALLPKSGSCCATWRRSVPARARLKRTGYGHRRSLPRSA